MRLLHLSDTHLGYRQYGLIERAEDTYEAFEEAVQIAIERSVDAVLHGGDMFHSSSPPPAVYRRVISALKRLKERGIPFYVAPGNHELPRQRGMGSPIKVLEDLGLLRSPENYEKPDEVSLGEATLYVFTDWSADMLFKRAPSAKISVALAHVALCDPAPQKEVEACKRGYTVASLPQGYAYVALGHYHNAWQKRRENTIIAYSGSTEFFSIDEFLERPERSINVVEISRDGEVKVEQVRLASPRPWLVAMGSRSEVMSTLSGLKQAAKPYIIHVRATISLESERAEIKSLLDRLMAEKRAIYYTLVAESPRERREERRDEKMSLEDIVEKRVGDRELASLLISYLKDQMDVKRLKEELSKGGRAEKVEKLMSRWYS